MHRKWILAASSGLMFTGIIAGALTNLRGGQAAAAQTPATSPAVKPAEEAFKNIQVLKGTPSDQVFPSMQFITASLGVDCEFCHVKDAFEKDDKPNKGTARKMIAMQMVINKDNFKNRPQVTCYSCHRGSNDPVAIPIISDEPPKPAAVAVAAEASAAPKLTPDQVLEKYTQAMGGAEALQKVSSRVGKGTVSFGGRQFPIEVLSKAPDKRIVIVQAPNGETITALNGSSGWLAGPGRPAHEMTSSEVESGRLDADFYFAAHPKQSLGQLRLGPPEKIGGRPAIVLFARREGAPPVRLYFDEESGLLVRMVRYNETPLGRNPVQGDFADYRDSGGVKLPFRLTVARPSGRFTIQINEMQQNVPVDDARFAMPPAPAPKPPSQ